MQQPPQRLPSSLCCLLPPQVACDGGLCLGKVGMQPQGQGVCCAFTCRRGGFLFSLRPGAKSRGGCRAHLSWSTEYTEAVACSVSSAPASARFASSLSGSGRAPLEGASAAPPPIQAEPHPASCQPSDPGDRVVVQPLETRPMLAVGQAAVGASGDLTVHVGACAALCWLDTAPQR